MILRNQATGLTYRISKHTRIGRSTEPDCDISIADCNVSRGHAEIRIQPEGFVIRDIGSKNGTFVNGNRISSSVLLAPGDTVKIGNAVFSVESGEKLREQDHGLTTDDLICRGEKGETIADVARVGVEPGTLRVVQQARRRETTRQSELLRERFRFIVELNSSIRSAGGLAELEYKVASQLLETFSEAKRCIIAFRGPRNKITIRAIVSRPKSDTTTVRISETIINHVLDEARAILCADAMADGKFADSRSISGMGIHSFMCAPLIGSKGPFGVVYLDAVEKNQQFTEEDLTLLTVIADQTSLAIENAQLIEQLDIERQRLSEENLRLRAKDALKCSFDSIVCVSRKMRDVLDLTSKIANTESPALILGQSGTGKELIAHAIHFNGPRSDKPFQIINCAAISGQLVESELFGHEKGAFTDARQAKPGLFEIANHGALFLDEVGDLPLETQAKLLRATENGQIRRLGATKDIEVNVRIIAATNKDLRKEAEVGRFRLDLYHRLNVAVIRIPSLAERREDILPLANHFISMLSKQMNKSVTGLSQEAISALRRYDWPGNVRELKNVIERAMIPITGGTIEVSHLPSEIMAASGIDIGKFKRVGRLPEAEAALKREMIGDALRESNGNKSQAAELLGVTRGGLRKMMKALGME